MIRRPPRSTRTDTLFPTRRSSDLGPRPSARSQPLVARLAPAQERGGGGQRIENARDDCEAVARGGVGRRRRQQVALTLHDRSEEHTSELQSLMRISYAVFCLKKKTNTKT